MGQKDEGCAADQVSDRIFTVPNIISFVRLCLVPVFLVLLLNGFNVAATLLYALAAGTDWIDSWPPAGRMPCPVWASCSIRRSTASS